MGYDDMVTLDVVMLGNQFVGKTSLMTRFASKDKGFSKRYCSTLESDFQSKSLIVEDRLVKLRIWDTAGQERFNSLSVSFYRKADCCIFVYDVTNPKSFQDLENWLNEFLIHANINHPDSFPFILIGNKSDLRRKIPLQRITSWCHSRNKMPHFECSAKTKTNVEAAFLALVEQALLTDFVVVNERPDVVSLERERRKAASRCAC